MLICNLGGKPDKLSKCKGAKNLSHDCQNTGYSAHKGRAKSFVLKTNKGQNLGQLPSGWEKFVT